jgi:hypothetical protein
VPVFRSRKEFYRDAINCSRTQFPVTIAYAITIHKAQGMTLQRAVLNVTDRDFVPGLSYVAVSRVKALNGLLFEEAFNYERFRGKQSETMQMRIADVERRRRDHVSSNAVFETVTNVSLASAPLGNTPLSTFSKLLSSPTLSSEIVRTTTLITYTMVERWWKMTAGGRRMARLTWD